MIRIYNSTMTKGTKQAPLAAKALLKNSVRYESDIVKRKSTGQTIVRYGPGGRSSVSGHTATVFGASGFLGRILVNRLGQIGTQIVVPYRGDKDDVRHLSLMGDLGQIVPLKFQLLDEKSLVECIRHSDTVYTAISRTYNTKNFNFTDVNIDGPRLIAKLSRELGVSRLIHISALNASPDSPSDYLKTKYVGELAVKEEFPNVTIVRPASLFGHEDRFLNRMASIAKLGFGAPIFNDGETLMRPVCVSDVASALTYMMKDEETAGEIFELYGPKEFTFNQLFESFCQVTKLSPNYIYVPQIVALFAARLIELAPVPVISVDEVKRMYLSDTVSTSGVKTFSDLGINPRNIEYHMLEYVRRHRKHDDFALPGIEPLK